MLSFGGTLWFGRGKPSPVCDPCGFSATPSISTVVAIVKLDAVEKTNSLYEEPKKVGTTFEIYLDFQSYYAFAGSWRWHWGVSLGNGISDFGKRSDIGAFIETGGTYRVEVGIGQVFH